MDHLVNSVLLDLARDRFSSFRKQAFVPGGDPMAGGGAPQGMPPDAAGGMPPDAGGMPPQGGPPPGPPPGGDSSGGDITQLLLQKMTALEARMGQGGAGGDAMIKPKIDVNVEILQMKKILARIADQLGVHIPAHEMVATPQDLTSMAQGQNQPAAPAAAGAISPIGGMSASGVPGQMKAGFHDNGVAYDLPLSLGPVADAAAAIRRFRKGAVT